MGTSKTNDQDHHNIFKMQRTHKIVFIVLFGWLFYHARCADGCCEDGFIKRIVRFILAVLEIVKQMFNKDEGGSSESTGVESDACTIEDLAFCIFNSTQELLS